MKTLNYTDEELRAIAAEMFKQLFLSVDKWTFFSWGVSKKHYLEYYGMATLAMRVSGCLHKGWVYISLNDGEDVYEVRLLNLKGKVKETIEPVYCDNLGEVIDNHIERKANWTGAQYLRKAIADSRRKLS